MLEHVVGRRRQSGIQEILFVAGYCHELIGDAFTGMARCGPSRSLGPERILRHRRNNPL
jgi:hypothetical protein